MTNVRRALADIGYTGALLQDDYDYALLESGRAETGRIDLAAFGGTPPSYRNACIGVAVANGRSDEALVSSCRDLGAPLILEIHSDVLRRWHFNGQGHPKHLENVCAKDVSNMFYEHQAAWSPQSILRVKSLHQKEQELTQLDFYDAGFFPLIESLVKEKLDTLLRDALATTTNEYRKSTKKEIDNKELFRLVFRFLAGKILVDRGALSSDQAGNPGDTLEAVDAYYNMVPEGMRSTTISDADTLMAAWEAIHSGLDFRNLSADDLAFVYENTLVSTDTRKQLGTHATPPSVAEYIVRKLPFEEIEQKDRRVLEPCSGHGVFLLSAMRRLRELLPPAISDAKRHQYLKARLVGIEIDAFAVEVARLSLMLADYPNKNDWKLHNEDVFSGDRLRRELMKSECVLCNPPYEDFSTETREHCDPDSVHKPIEILRRVLEHPPSMLGFVLPKSFLSRSAGRIHQRSLTEKYNVIETVTLPDRVFSHSDSETVLLMAWGRKQASCSTLITCREVASSQCDTFLKQGEEPSGRTDTVETARESSPHFSIWIPKLSRVWRYLDKCATLGNFADIHRGIEYNIPLKWRALQKQEKCSEDEAKAGAERNRTRVFRDSASPGFEKGVQTANAIHQFGAPRTRFLCLQSDLVAGNAHKRPWNEPKILANYVRLSRGPWRFAATCDYDGLVAYRNVYGIWPKDTQLLRPLTALLNSPVANGFLFVQSSGKHNSKNVLERIPLPYFDNMLIEELTERVQLLEQDLQLISKTRTSKQGEISSRLYQKQLSIDAFILDAYDLPPRLERELLDTFQGYERPVPGISFTGYYPEGFKACFPLHEIISEEFERARSENLLRRLTPVNDPVIHEMLATSEDGD